MSDSRNSHELIDNITPKSFLPSTKIPKYDNGILEVAYFDCQPKEPAYFGYQQTSPQATVEFNNAGLNTSVVLKF